MATLPGVDLAALRDELDARNVDNLTRTASYLMLYEHTRDHLELPWLLMAHLVSRNTGYLMSDLGRRTLSHPDDAVAAQALFAFLERGNYLIFHDAWYHTLSFLLGDLDPNNTRITRFMHEAWPRFVARGQPAQERQLALDLVENEQRFIEHHLLHDSDHALAIQAIGFIEAAGRERPLYFPYGADDIRVGGFADLSRRIAAGQRIYDEVVGPHHQQLRAWALDHPHTGSREVYGGQPGPTVTAAWPRIRHTPPAPGL